MRQASLLSLKEVYKNVSEGLYPPSELERMAGHD